MDLVSASKGRLSSNEFLGNAEGIFRWVVVKRLCGCIESSIGWQLTGNIRSH